MVNPRHVKKRKRHGPYWVYMVRCSLGMYYTGYTNDLARRIKAHNAGRGAKYLRGKTPVVLVYARKYRLLKSALKAEWVMKQYSRAEKEARIYIFGLGEQ